MGKTHHIKIVKQSLSRQAADIIKSKILSGTAPPGHRFIVDILAEELGVSRTPVREGLSLLASQGLITYEGNTYVVTNYTRKDVQELFQIRLALEVLAVRQAVQVVDDSSLKEFRDMCIRGKRVGSEEIEQYLIDLDGHLHGMIGENANNERLKTILNSIMQQLRMILNWGIITKRIQYRETATIEEFLAFCDHMKNKDAESAARLMEEHLSNGEEVTLDCLGL